MANPPKAKGTAYETKVVGELREWFPYLDISRTEAGKESYDIRGLGFPVECKKRKTWQIPNWVRKLRRVASTEDAKYPDAYIKWALFVSPGDMRRTDTPDIVVVDKLFFYMLLQAYMGSEE